MARFLQFAKYTPQACAAVFEDGWAQRRAVLEKYVEGMGGKMIDMYAVASDEWDFVVHVEADDLGPAKTAAHLLRVYGAGAIERSMTVSIATLDEVDAARSSLPGYTPPGQ
jgi:uncharacterized protein with GYD domain